MRFLFALIIICWCMQVGAQNYSEYELKESEKYFATLGDAKVKYQQFCNDIRWAHILNNSDPDSANIIYDQAITIASNTKNKSLEYRLLLDKTFQAVRGGNVELTDSLLKPFETVKWDGSSYLLHFFYLRIKSMSNKVKDKFKISLTLALEAQKILEDGMQNESDKNIVALCEIGLINIKSDLSNLYNDTKQTEKSIQLQKENLNKILAWDNNFLTKAGKKPSDKDYYLANSYSNLALTLINKLDWSNDTSGDTLIENYLNNAISLNKKNNNQGFLARTYYNYARYYKGRQNLDQREVYLEKAAEINRKIGEKTGLITCYYEISQNLLNKKKDPARALMMASDALQMARNIPNLGTMGDIFLTYCKALNANGRSEEAAAFFDSAEGYKAEEMKSTFDQEITEMQTKYETAEKEKAIVQKDSEIKQKKSQMVLVLLGALAVGVIAIIAIVSYVQKRKANQIIELEKNRSDNLLLNILPEETAAELKTTGHAEAKHYDNCTVMFTDFKDFTKVSESLSPKELVGEIDFCFREFDSIISKYNIEKIKTIGDAYMCVANLPKPNPNHAADMVSAALEINAFIKKLHAERAANGVESFQIRIGLHTGALVAGVVGTKKFAYDVWGDTVNTASRMESSGEPGMVNISGTTYELVKGQFHCEHRGKIKAKNKGEIDMYFVS